MAETRTVEDLALEQQSQLSALLDELETLPTPEAIVASRLICIGELKLEERITEVDRAMAGGWAAARVIPYLLQLRRLDQQRLDLGMAIYHHKHHPEPQHESEIVDRARAEVLAIEYSGEQEVVYNLFCICVQHIRSFLKIAAETVGYEIDADDLAFLDEFRHLRNHYEHMYNRLPGKVNELALLTKKIGTTSYRVRGGLETDSKQRIIVKELKGGLVMTHVVDITSAGMERVERIVGRTWNELKPTAINNARKHYIAAPSKIPSPEAVPQNLLMQVGGYIPPQDEESSQTQED
jgi:hypothetical protein